MKQIVVAINFFIHFASFILIILSFFIILFTLVPAQHFESAVAMRSLQCFIAGLKLSFLSKFSHH